MQKAKAHHDPVQKQRTVRQGKGVALAPAQGEQIAQLEAMIESSPQAAKLAQLAAMANNSAVPRNVDIINSSLHMTAQYKAVDGINSAPYATEQRQRLGSLVRETAQREAAEEPSQAKVSQRPESPTNPNHTGIPDNLKRGIEALSGISMDDIKVHYNSSQPAQLNALAYAQGTDIHVAPGQEKHLPHEAWHVVQQAQGRVKPTMQMKEGVPVNDDAGLEHEADVMGGRAVQMAHAPEDKRNSPGTGPALKHQTLQLKKERDEERKALVLYAEEIKETRTQEILEHVYYSEGVFLSDDVRDFETSSESKGVREYSIVLPDMATFERKQKIGRNEVDDNGAGVKANCRTMAAHELMHLRLGFRNDMAKTGLDLDTSAPSFDNDNISKTIFDLSILVRKSAYERPEAAGPKKFILSRLEYISDIWNEDKSNREAPPVMKELRLYLERLDPKHFGEVKEEIIRLDREIEKHIPKSPEEQRDMERESEGCTIS